MPARLTKAQRKWLERMREHEAHAAERKALGDRTHPELTGPGHTDNFRTFDRVMARLTELGLAERYYNGWILTDAGRAALDA